MTTLIPSALPPTGPSPARNPFARPKLPSASSFTRATLLPNHASPVVPSRDPLSTPATAGLKGAVSASKGTKSWRLLWRGGLEIGEAGWRLDGIMFYAMLAFPSTPSGSQSNVNPFDFFSPPRPNASSATSPFALPTADTDLCLSLESMRGRKYLQVRGLTDLPENEVLEGDTDEGGVQISISPQAPLLAGYLTSVLCRTGKLSGQGRTLTAIVIGLGDEGMGQSQDTSLLVYGQKQTSDDGVEEGTATPTLKLCVARRKAPPAPPSVLKVRPGDPLPRAPLFFPSRQFAKKLSHRPLSRTTSTASIYAPPVLHHASTDPLPISRSHSESTSHQLPLAPVTGRTPGRRGEKRKRPSEEEDEKKRKNGKIVLDKERSVSLSRMNSGMGEEEDIFGTRPPLRSGPSSDSITGSRLGVKPDGDEEIPSATKKRSKIPQQILDNKATIRKQTLLLLESSGHPRDHEIFKEVFSMVTKGTYFAFRNEMENSSLCKLEVQRVVGVHLDLYLPKAPPDEISSTKGEQEDEKAEVLRSIKEEDEDEDTLVDIGEVKLKVDV